MKSFKIPKSILGLSLVVFLMVLSACGGPAATPQESAPADTSAEEAAPADTATEEPAQADTSAEEPAEEAAAEEPAGDKEVLNVWSFTNEINTMAIAYEGLHPNVDVKYTMIPMTNGEYQTKLKAALGTADAPDVIALEASFVKELVESNILTDLGEFLPDAETAETYPFVIEVG
ncbi:MAG TPA: extracellular solute-binding protein, partial [Anaerolineae bacterium]|nr:extracellular solute-binding protein [Anaerolineae bacterium]